MSALTRIICTRKINDLDKQEAMSRGFQIADRDFLSFDYLSDNYLAEIIGHAAAPLVFTSQHAVKAVFKIISQYQIELKNKDCFCIEGETKQHAAHHGFNVIGEASNSASLASVIIASERPEIVFFGGNLKRDELMDVLTAGNIKADEYVVYNKSLLPLKIEEDYQGVMFFSPSQVDAFSKANYLAREIPAFCIGTTTGDYLNIKGHKNTLVAEQSNTKAVLRKIYEYYQS